MIGLFIQDKIMADETLGAREVISREIRLYYGCIDILSLNAIT